MSKSLDRKNRKKCHSCSSTIEGNRTRCSKCRYKDTKEASKRRKEAVKKGLCRDCCIRECLPNVVHCESCYLRRAAINNQLKSCQAEELKRLLIQQNFTCPYTGDKLVLGVNASIDHIKPKKRFPELASDINNIEWVSFRVNYHKYDCTKEEFIELCKTVVLRCT